MAVGKFYKRRMTIKEKQQIKPLRIKLLKTREQNPNYKRLEHYRWKLSVRKYT